MGAAGRTKLHLSNALKNLSKEMPLAKITVKDLCQFSNVNRGTFYYHFKDIFDLVSWTYHTEIILPSRKIMDSYPITELPSLTSFILRKIYNDKGFYSQALTLDKPHSFEYTMLRDSLENWQMLWKKAVQCTTFQDINYENKDTLLEYFVRGHYYATLHWVETGMKANPEELGKALDDASLRGLVSIWNDILEKK